MCFIRKNWKKQLPFATIILLQKTFATKNCLVTLDKLHKTLVASVDEVNGQQNTPPSIYSCMPFIYYQKNQQLT